MFAKKKFAKICLGCGKGTVKLDRPTCKKCGGAAFDYTDQRDGAAGQGSAAQAQRNRRVGGRRETRRIERGDSTVAGMSAKSNPFAALGIGVEDETKGGSDDDDRRPSMRRASIRGDRRQAEEDEDDAVGDAVGKPDLQAVLAKLYDTFGATNKDYDFTELSTALTVLCSDPKVETTRQAFNLYDVDGNGYITMQEMTTYLGRIFKVKYAMYPKTEDRLGMTSDQLAAAAAHQAFHSADHDDDGLLTFEEFKAWHQKTNPMAVGTMPEDDENPESTTLPLPGSSPPPSDPLEPAQTPFRDMGVAVLRNMPQRAHRGRYDSSDSDEAPAPMNMDTESSEEEVRPAADAAGGAAAGAGAGAWAPRNSLQRVSGDTDSDEVLAGDTDSGDDTERFMAQRSAMESKKVMGQAVGVAIDAEEADKQEQQEGGGGAAGAAAARPSPLPANRQRNGSSGGPDAGGQSGTPDSKPEVALSTLYCRDCFEKGHASSASPECPLAKYQPKLNRCYSCWRSCGAHCAVRCACAFGGVALVAGWSTALVLFLLGGAPRGAPGGECELLPGLEALFAQICAGQATERLCFSAADTCTWRPIDDASAAAGAPPLLPWLIAASVALLCVAPLLCCGARDAGQCWRGLSHPCFRLAHALCCKEKHSRRNRPVPASERCRCCNCCCAYSRSGARTVGEFEMTEQHLGSVRTSVVLDVEVPDALGGRRPSV